MQQFCDQLKALNETEDKTHMFVFLFFKVNVRLNFSISISVNNRDVCLYGFFLNYLYALFLNCRAYMRIFLYHFKITSVL